MDEFAQVYHGLTDPVYHIDLRCPVGRQIPPEWVILGPGDRALCPTCRARLEARPPGGPPPVAPSADHEG
jgi:hypothetical protein